MTHCNRLALAAIVLSAACTAGASSTPVDGSSSSGAGNASSQMGASSASLMEQSSSVTPASSRAGSLSSGSVSGGTADPAVAGPFVVAPPLTATIDLSGAMVAVEEFAPQGAVGARPVVIIAPGFRLPVSQYRNYARRLASHGFIAVLVAYDAGLFNVNHLQNARELLAAVDWVTSRNGVPVDAARVGAMGHSLGGKLALHAATLDPRIKAVLGVDPVDGAMGCSAANCPDVSDLMSSLVISTGFLGERTDATGGFQPCAPAADNFLSFYAGTPPPSFAVTVSGANHMSFLDDVASCGFLCSFCNAATAPNAQVNDLSVAYAAAFFLRHLQGDAAYDAYLVGAAAQERYVLTGQATLQNR